ncbi:sensor histidine kinase [Pseudonocardia sp. HH130629-09]|uniref:sensor histidine kinase n=1 Tax=Pseudonocardia sp. HH130629-09 TaxID=1641402 RepID=UPI000761AB89|nr:ATP-binding protein [Pseudonocardia sp. HH130629-09]
MKIQAQEPCLARGDDTRVRQIISNLLTNAVRHTPRGGTVTVAVSTHADQALLSAADTGPGISAEHVDVVFDRFWRADPARGRDGGAGLGLAISRELARAQGGDLTVEGRDGIGALGRPGARFVLRLPRPAHP